LTECSREHPIEFIEQISFYLVIAHRLHGASFECVNLA
jgi:hypothetical protein